MSARQAKAIMVLGTGSGVGKSWIAAGLCRILSDAGLSVAPFKAQNMSNNSFVTREGGEMGRAQVVQAECARIEPSVHMNPILLKPAADDGSQVIVHGKAIGTMRAGDYYSLRDKIWSAIKESYEKLSREFEVLVIEGAGSPAEVNLKAFDLVNFRVAELADASCLLAGDIDRGGVFAWLLGTLALLDESERDRIAGLVINKFRGDLTLLEPGLRSLENLSGKKVLGVLPYESDLWIEEEDSVFVMAHQSKDETRPSLDIAVILCPRISNATDFQILTEEPGVSLRMIRRIEEFGTPDLLILPGTKATLADLRYLKIKGFVEKIRGYARSGGRVLGICGGFQMLGERIEDWEGTESGSTVETGLSLLPARTRFSPEKTLDRVKGRTQNKIFSYPVEGMLLGYEIHMGQTELGKGVKPFCEVSSLEGEDWRPEGALDPSGRILGTYLHGLFDEASFRRSFLDALWQSSGKKKPLGGEPVPSMSFVKERNYDRLAELLRAHLNLSFLEPCLKFSLPLV